MFDKIFARPSAVLLLFLASFFIVIAGLRPFNPLVEFVAILVITLFVASTVAMFTLEKRRVANLQTKGVKLQGKVTEIHFVAFPNAKSQSLIKTFSLTVEVNDPKFQQIKTYSTKPIFAAPPILTNSNLVNVYIDEKNSKNFLIDLNAAAFPKNEEFYAKVDSGTYKSTDGINYTKTEAQKSSYSWI